MAVTADDAGRIRSSRARLPTQGRGEALLLLGPCALYLAAFSIFPLITSLVRSFQDYDTRADTWTWIGLRNYSELVHSSEFWTVVQNTAVLTGAGVAIQVVLGTALALFFNQQLRGAWIVRGILILPMLLTPIVVGLMWRALLNPDWGIINWSLGELGLPEPLWLGDPAVALWTLVLVDSWQWTPFVMVIVFARLQALPRDVFEASQVDGAGRLATLTRITLPLLAPAIVFAGIFRAIDAFRSFDVVFGLTYGGPGRFTTTLSFYTFENGFTFQRYGFASAMAYVMVIVASIGLTLLVRFASLRREDAT